MGSELGQSFLLPLPGVLQCRLPTPVRLQTCCCPLWKEANKDGAAEANHARQSGFSGRARLGALKFSLAPGVSHLHSRSGCLAPIDLLNVFLSAFGIHQRLEVPSSDLVIQASLLFFFKKTQSSVLSYAVYQSSDFSVICPAALTVLLSANFYFSSIFLCLNCKSPSEL